jgi:peptidoglycan/LPS O-acetylase OafA/YrhL
MNDAQSNLINFLRWISAFVVVISHSRRLTFIPYDDLGNPSISSSFFYLATGFGHQAVIIFFVLSGYLVSSSLLKNTFITRDVILRYFIDRFARIYPPLVLALIFTALATYCVSNFLEDPWRLFPSSNNGHFEKLNTTSFDPITFFGNLFALQTVHVSVFGYNLPLWSLAYEIWFYIWFPLLVIIFSFNMITWQRCICALILITTLMLMGNHMSLYFFIWLVGFSINYIVLPQAIKIKWIAWFLLGSVLLFTRVQSFINDLFILDIILSLAVVLLIVSYKNVPDQRNQNKKLINKYMADFSYSLYLVHYPVIMILSSIFYTYYNYGFQLSPEFKSIAYFMVLIITPYFFGLCLSIIAERRNYKIRQKLYKIFMLNNSQIVKN